MVVFLLSLLLQPSLAFDHQCGKYEMEGILHRQNESFIFVANEKSTSELTVSFEKTKLLQAEHDGVAALLQFEISKDCVFKCQGKLLKVVSILDPMKSPKTSTLGLIHPLQTNHCK